MTAVLHWIDWLVIALYLLGLIGFAVWLARSQHNREDYYVAGRGMGAWPIAISVMATQCSTNSILGAPAFVAFAAGGGLIWLQYELAVPLAMMVLMLFFMPTFYRLQLVSVYGFLESRFDRKTRLHLSGLFLFVRAFATAVTVYGIALVIDLITGIGFTASVLLLGAFTVLYDVIGGIKGVVYSDVIQLAILVGVLLLVLILLINSAGGFGAMLQALPSERTTALDFSAHGLGDGETFGFWPMLLGGVFLYVSYYGCDQSQVQRELCAKNLTQTNKALFLNGLLRFPLVALYCFVGVGIGAYAIQQPEFLQLLPTTHGSPNYNMAVPAFFISQLPIGLVGLALVALFAAAMSSLDSVLNALSASTMEDFVRPALRDKSSQLSMHQELQLSRIITIIWGCITLALAFWVDDIASTVLEAINKIGSLANGPILAVFALGLFGQNITGLWARIGFWTGIASNVLLWQFAQSISWLWWNVSGFIVASAIAAAGSTLHSVKFRLAKLHSPISTTPSAQGSQYTHQAEPKRNTYAQALEGTPTYRYALALGLFFIVMLILLTWL